MAGDWIKVEHATPDKAEVVRIADLLGIHPDQATGLLIRFWIWVDRNMRHDSVTHLYAKTIDTVTQCAGFSGALAAVDWAIVDPNTGLTTLSNIVRHNGTPAKTRALSRDRKVTERSRKSHAETSPREEKRRTTTSLRSVVATRLPDDWVLPKAWGEWALAAATPLYQSLVRAA